MLKLLTQFLFNYKRLALLSDTLHALVFTKLRFSLLALLLYHSTIIFQQITLSILTYSDWLSQYYFNSQYYANDFNLTVFT